MTTHLNLKDKEEAKDSVILSTLGGNSDLSKKDGSEGLNVPKDEYPENYFELLEFLGA